MNPEEEVLARWTTCRLSGERLSIPLCADELGSLYNKSAVVAALVRLAALPCSPSSCCGSAKPTCWLLCASPQNYPVPAGCQDSAGVAQPHQQPAPPHQSAARAHQQQGALTRPHCGVLTGHLPVPALLEGAIPVQALLSMLWRTCTAGSA